MMRKKMAMPRRGNTLLYCIPAAPNVPPHFGAGLH
jgi:hypothetical protein